MNAKVTQALRPLREFQAEVQDAFGQRWRALPRLARIGITIAFIVFLFLLPVLRPPIITTPDASFDSVLYYPIALFVLAALGLNVVVGFAGLLDLGYVAFFAIGAYTVGVLGAEHGTLPWIVCVPIGVAVAMASGVLLGSPTLRLRGDYLAIVTLGFGEIVRIVANNTQWLGGAEGIADLPKPPSVGPWKFDVLHSRPYYWLALCVIIVVVFFIRRLEHSRVGRAWTAIREDEDAAELMGVPTFKFKLWAFAIGAAIGGLSGTLYAGYVSAITPETFTLQLSILFLAAVVLGGAGNVPGVIIGAVLVSYLPERFRNFEEWRVFIFGAALVVMMVFRPQGILPSKQRSAELHHPIEQGDLSHHGGSEVDAPFDPVEASGAEEMM